MQLSVSIKGKDGQIKTCLVYYQDYVCLNTRAQMAITAWYPGLTTIKCKIIEYKASESTNRLRNFN